MSKSQGLCDVRLISWFLFSKNSVLSPAAVLLVHTRGRSSIGF